MAEPKDASETLFEQLRHKLHELLYAASPPTEAPTFAPTLPEAERREIKTLQAMPGAVVVNGVTLPQNVINQLQQLGLPLSWYNNGELEDAVIACAFDGNLIDEDDDIPCGEHYFTDEKKHMQELRRIAAELGEPVRVLTSRTLGVCNCMTTYDIREKIAHIRAASLPGCGPEPIPPTHYG